MSSRPSPARIYKETIFLQQTFQTSSADFQAKQEPQQDGCRTQTTFAAQGRNLIPFPQKSSSNLAQDFTQEYLCAEFSKIHTRSHDLGNFTRIQRIDACLVDFPHVTTHLSFHISFIPFFSLSLTQSKQCWGTEGDSVFVNITSSHISRHHLQDWNPRQQDFYWSSLFSKQAAEEQRVNLVFVNTRIVPHHLGIQQDS